MLRRLNISASLSSSKNSCLSAASSSFLSTQRFKSNKTTKAEDVAALIPDGATITVGGFVAVGSPEAVLEAVGQRFKETQHPANCTLLFEGGPGDFKNRGINHLAQEGLITRAIGAHYGQVPMLAELALANKIQAYNFPMGSISRMIRAAASKGPGHLTKIGFGTMVDPKYGGGKINPMTPDFVQEVTLNGEQYLFFPALPIDVAIVRGTTADTEGNISFEREALYSDHFLMAQAASTNRGISVAQVERVCCHGSINQKNAFIPGSMIDAVVVAPPEKHFMTYFTEYNPAASGEIRKVMSKHASGQELDERKVVARRAAMELAPDFRVNLGIGMPDGVAKVASEEKLNEFVSFSTEAGVYGGVGMGGQDFGPAENADSLIQLHQQFDFYNGGGLDICFLGLGEVDPHGDVNVTRLGKKLTGPGGFIDISQATERVNLLGSFTAGAVIAVEDGKLKIVKEGHTKKFVKSVREITFSGPRAVALNQKVKYITERCVFELGADAEGKAHLILKEIAPGLTVEKDILPMMDFKPVIPEGGVAVMPDYIFRNKPMGLLEKGFLPDFTSRTAFAPATNTLYINLANISINGPEIVEKIFTRLHAVCAEHAEKKLAGTEKKFNFVVNYNRFEIDLDMVDAYHEAVKTLTDKWCLTSRRFSSRAFRRHQMGSQLHINEEKFTAQDLSKLLQQLGALSPQAAHALAQYKPTDIVPCDVAENLLDSVNV